MKTRLLLIALLGFAAATPAGAQQATEQFIPLGSSPGLSATKTRIGIIESFDPASAVLSLATERGSAELTPQTRIWLDRSKLNLSNLPGLPSDLKPGQRCEIRYAQPGSRKVEWVKIEATRP
jgi:hypothetical protein